LMFRPCSVRRLTRIVNGRLSGTNPHAVQKADGFAFLALVERTLP
jgi:hypothetical protein